MENSNIQLCPDKQMKCNEDTGQPPVFGASTTDEVVSYSSLHIGDAHFKLINKVKDFYSLNRQHRTIPGQL